ncbi:tyrosine-type recombinase/integrase [Mesorhizobium sp. M0011]|uniref:tyrosine-type recombinase/integrase n=1 Tax=unclassified Mesorhizobium TaxID=325217 RepID=UPI00333739F3
MEWDDLVFEEIELFDGALEVIEAFDFRQKKTATITAGARCLLAPLDRSKGGTVLKNAYGHPFAEKSLTGMMAHWHKQAGIPEGYTLHGLRRTFGTYLAECNIQAHAIMEAMAFFHDGDGRICPRGQQEANGCRHSPRHQ